MVKTGFVKLGEELYGQQRNMTEEERKLYKKVTKEHSVPLGVCVYDCFTDRFVELTEENCGTVTRNTDAKQNKRDYEYELWRRECQDD